MSNAIIGIALPANVVEVVRLMLEDLSRAPNEQAVAYRLGELDGSFRTLERLQRLTYANAGRLYAHASAIAHERERVLREKPQ